MYSTAPTDWAVFEDKVIYIFRKKCVRSFVGVVHNRLIVSSYICIHAVVLWLYNTTTSKFDYRLILEGVRAKSLEATVLFIDFSKTFDSIHRGKMEQILLAYGFPKETAATSK